MIKTGGDKTKDSGKYFTMGVDFVASYASNYLYKNQAELMAKDGVLKGRRIFLAIVAVLIVIVHSIVSLLIDF